MIRLKEEKCIIGFDDGYQLGKTANFIFDNGVYRLGAVEPTLKENSLFYDGEYFKVGEGRSAITEDKISDDSARLRTMTGIAMELRKEGLYKAEVVLAVGLPTAISILIGFTVMLITLLLTSSGENIDNIKKITTDKMIYGKAITLYQGLHIQFSHSLFSEIFLLLIVLFYLFLNGLGWVKGIDIAFLGIEVYLTLNILLSILRGIANLYFSFYKSNIK